MKRNPIATENIVFFALQGGPATRDELVRRTGLPRSTIFDALTRLEAKCFVKKQKVKVKVRGRPRTLWLINKEMIS